MSFSTNKLQFRPKYCNFPLNLEITSNTSAFLLNFSKGKFRERSSRPNHFASCQTPDLDKSKVLSNNSCECSLTSEKPEASADDGEKEECFDLTQEINLTNEDPSNLYQGVDLECWINLRVTPLRGFAEHFNLIGAYCEKSVGFQARELSHEDVAKVAFDAVDKQNVSLALNVVKTLCEIPHPSLNARRESDWLLFKVLCFLINEEVFVTDIVFELFNAMETYFNVPCFERVRFEKAIYILKHKLFEDSFIKPLNQRCPRPENRRQDEDSLLERKLWASRLHAAIGIVKHQQILKLKQELDFGVKSLLEASQFGPDTENEDFDASLRLELAIEELEQFLYDFEQDENGLSSELGNPDEFVPYLIDLKCLAGFRHEATEILEKYIKKFPENANLQTQMDILNAMKLF